MNRAGGRAEAFDDVDGHAAARCRLGGHAASPFQQTPIGSDRRIATIR
ncbi:hypothetical protein SB758_14110 [Burkholderia sp. SIMBA_013]|jgi:hypothetical protein